MEQANYECWMREALAMANRAAELDEVPVGAVVVRAGEIIARAHERKVELSDPTAHAEILALRHAAQQCGDWRLEGCALVATLEPCPMCAGAALLARVPLVVYGASNDKFGAIETHMQVLAYPRWNHSVEVIKGVLAEECGDVLRKYFAAKRTRTTEG